MPADQTSSLPRPRPNRVTPFGVLEATPTRGALMGNRGDLHGPDGDIRRNYLDKAWICCTLEERNGRRVTFDRKGRYTPLFFWDEAVAFAAGHRPCAECRRADFRRFKSSFNRARGAEEDHFVPVREIDRLLHADRLHRKKSQQRFSAALGDLPSGTFFVTHRSPETPALLWQGKAYPWSHQGYGPASHADLHEEVSVLTPRLLVDVLRAGYPVEPRF